MHFLISYFMLWWAFEIAGDHVLEMSADALAYHKVVKENRNLYNMVQDLKGSLLFDSFRHA